MKKLGRVLAGAAAAAIVSTVVAVTPSSAAGPSYNYQCWGWAKDHCNVAVQAPKGWKFTQLDQFEAKFTKGTNQLLRVDGIYAKVSPKAQVARKTAALRKVPGLKILSQYHGVERSTIPGNAPKVVYYDVKYSYTDGARGYRVVTTRYADTLDGGNRAYVELTVGGRLQDQAELQQVLRKATQTVTLVG
ncbi:hypothetical protein HPO96_21405 [Kribbella sandramycini]|uniref:Uncharacterized protein n=1 Tax=Kribbella sandramycini TaxID=60450 RepID=A0A7Y4L3L7_9ACTN|nr:hypothetical protein [Kribbella sandramycini]MBB6566537.1 hypothetical protein [Kribbella sandramycini]NOL42806.1 hypothetical protein [Kribbella sandramycini]